MSNHQFECSICGQGFEQKSRLERHMASSHPPQAPSAADVENVLSGIHYPKSKEDLVQYASQKISTVGQDLFNLIKSLPSRTFRDSADVAVALGELKSGKRMRSAEKAKATEQPSKKGGRTAATYSVSAAAVAKALYGIDFPKDKDSLKDYAKRNISKVETGDPNAILDVINRIPDRQYNDMADVEKSVGSII
jgi:citrate synthase